MHVKLYLVKNAFRRIQAQCQDAECSRVMMCLAKLYAYDTILSAAAEFTKVCRCETQERYLSPIFDLDH